MPEQLEPNGSVLLDKIKSISKKCSDLQQELEELVEFKNNIEARIRVLETLDIDKLKQDIYKIDSKVESFKSDHDERKEKFKIAFNFIVQLVWVSMAAWLLTRLGLQPPL